MPRSAALTCLALAIAATSAGCPHTGPKQPKLTPVARDTALLVIPLTADNRQPATDALTRLSDLATGGDIAAAWARVHYLMDLFDDARFRSDDASLTMLHEALGRTDDQEPRGPQTTDWVLAELVREIDDIIGGDRMHPYAQSARTLLEFDARPPASRVGLLTRMGELKAIAKRDHPLADNARLRLFGYCRSALFDVATAKYAERHRVLAHCLYPLYASNPEPYYARRPEDRPPTPSWRDIVTDLLNLADQVAAGKRRLALAGDAGRRSVVKFTGKHAASMPVAPEASALGVAAAERATPYDWTPLILLGAGREPAHMADGRLVSVEVLGKAIAGDGRGMVAIALTGAAPAQVVTNAGASVASAGAETLELAVAIEQFLKVPRGDYWFERIKGDTVARLGVIPVSLAPLRGAEAIKTRTWDPSRATLGLHLQVNGGKWILSGPTGVVSQVDASDKARAQQTLRGVLAWLYAAFPDEDAVVVVPGDGASVTELVAALEALRHDAQGRELIAQVGLGKAAPPVKADVLAGRIERRSKASVTIKPSALAVRTSVVRACYQDVLDNRPKARGEFRLELAGDAVNITSGPKEPALRDCLLNGLSPVMKAQKMASAEVKLTAE